MVLFVLNCPCYTDTMGYEGNSATEAIMDALTTKLHPALARYTKSNE